MEFLSCYCSQYDLRCLSEQVIGVATGQDKLLLIALGMEAPTSM